MKKFVLSLVLTTLCFSNFFAQTLAVIEKGDELDPSYMRSRCIGNIGLNKYILCWYQKSGKLDTKIALYQFDLNNKLIKNVEFKSDLIGKEKTRMATIKVIASKLFLFKYTLDDGKCALYAQELDPNDLSLKGDLKKITEREYKYENDVIGRSFFSIGLNSDSSKVEIYTNNINYELYSMGGTVIGGKKAVLYFDVLNSDLSPVWKKDVELEFKPDEIIDISIPTFISSSGELYGFFYTKLDKKINWNMSCHLFHVDNTGTNYEIKSVAAPSAKALSNLSFFQKGNETFLVGLYSDADYRFAKGYFIASLNKTDLTVKSSRDFPADIIKKFNSNSVYPNKNNTNELLSPRDLYVKASADGGLLLGIFQTSTEVIPIQNGFINQYPGGNCLFIRVNEKYEEKWSVLIGRKINTRDYSNSSAAVFCDKNIENVYVFYADHVENITNTIENTNMLIFGGLIEGGNQKQECFAIAKIDKNGSVTKEHYMPYKTCENLFKAFDFYGIDSKKEILWMPKTDGKIQLYKVQIK